MLTGEFHSFFSYFRGPGKLPFLFKTQHSREIKQVVDILYEQRIVLQGTGLPIIMFIAYAKPAVTRQKQLLSPIPIRTFQEYILAFERAFLIPGESNGGGEAECRHSGVPNIGYFNCLLDFRIRFFWFVFAKYPGG